MDETLALRSPAPTALAPEAALRGEEALPRLAGQNIVCFSKDWTEDPTSNNHVLKLLAADNKVLWLNSISTRNPRLASGRDLGKIWRKLRASLRGPREVHPNLWVYTPLVLPFPHNPVATSVNRWILRRTIALLRRRLGMRQFQLWSFLPNVAEYVGTLGESLVVYYCTDEWSLFTGIDRERMAAVERELCRKADVVFATSGSLFDKRKQYNPEIHLATHGVDHEVFARALSDETPVPEDLAALPRPVIGFYGLVEDWVDFDLIAHLAESHPEWSIVLVGKVCVDVSRLSRYPNVHLLGRKQHSELPGYCKGFSVGMIPYILNDRILTVNPIKLREYLSAGLPVVSTPLPEVLRYRELCHIGRTHEEFGAAVEEALAGDSPERRRRRSEAMRSETWDRKVAAIGAHVARAQERRRRARA